MIPYDSLDKIDLSEKSSLDEIYDIYIKACDGECSFSLQFEHDEICISDNRMIFYFFCCRDLENIRDELTTRQYDTELLQIAALRLMEYSWFYKLSKTNAVDYHYAASQYLCKHHGSVMEKILVNRICEIISQQDEYAVPKMISILR